MIDISLQKDLMFIYGTLLKNLISDLTNYLHGQSKIIGKGYILGRLYDLGNYPGALYNSEEKSRVNGIIIKLIDPTRMLKILDKYEGAEGSSNSNLFIRKMVPVIFNNSHIYCWVYLYNKSTNDFPLIDSGDNLTYLKNKKNSDS